ncbi:2-amino-4-hydroxy-6-hydroxymethyldihydropteridine diphosphokinase [Shimia biformata]|uniref:2-amino-4-hydroxy-6- hydroxymethyldihydropteridine diphosphokinase n=1 Tax=Shimia biformata TaxID=1294299 RepID=UPI001951E0E3|nr:2-amino-4-hydroxy-6-hydroxymethyldihydropteridine diphosphokinase [Shimia biformata]
MNKNWLLALGGNLDSAHGAPDVTLRDSFVKLNMTPLRLVSVSRFFRTPCFPAGAGPDYVNAAAVVRSALPADEVLDILHKIEADFGRARTQRWGMRTLDIDLLGCDDLVLPDEATQSQWRGLQPEEQVRVTPDQLILPHPRMQDRAFVLVPLCDIAAGWRHPILGQTVAQMCENLPDSDRNAVVPL